MDNNVTTPLMTAKAAEKLEDRTDYIIKNIQKIGMSSVDLAYYENVKTLCIDYQELKERVASMAQKLSE